MLELVMRLFVIAILLTVTYKLEKSLVMQWIDEWHVKHEKKEKEHG